jgi:hypothetical protein
MCWKNTMNLTESQPVNKEADYYEDVSWEIHASQLNNGGIQNG